MEISAVQSMLTPLVHYMAPRNRIDDAADERL